MATIQGGAAPGAPGDVKVNGEPRATSARRFIIPVGLLLILALGYMDRVNFSVAGPALMEQFNISTGAFGLLSSSFNWTYLVMLIPMGIVADRMSTKHMLPLFIVIWSIAAGITGLAAGVAVLLVSRLLMGIGESPINTAGQVVIREWAPAPDRGKFASLFNVGALIGPAVGSIVAAWLVTSYGWRASFFVLGGVGIVVGVIWYLVYHSPEKCWWLPAAEREYIVASRETTAGVAKATVQKMGLGSLLKTKTMWGLMGTHGCMVYTNYLFLTFLPTYLVQARGLKTLGSGWVTGTIYAAAAIVSLAIGVVADRVARRASADKLLPTRRWSLITVLLMAMVLLVLPLVTSTVWIAVLIAWVLAFDFAGIALNWTLASDLVVDKGSIGRLFSLITVGGNVLGLLAPIVTGYLVQWSGSYTWPFVIAGALLVLGALCTYTLSRRALQPARVFS